jgi:hypothetical protein
MNEAAIRAHLMELDRVLKLHASDPGVETLQIDIAQTTLEHLRSTALPWASVFDAHIYAAIAPHKNGFAWKTEPERQEIHNWLDDEFNAAITGGLSPWPAGIANAVLVLPGGVDYTTPFRLDVVGDALADTGARHTLRFSPGAATRLARAVEDAVDAQINAPSNDVCYIDATPHNIAVADLQYTLRGLSIPPAAAVRLFDQTKWVPLDPSVTWPSPVDHLELYRRVAKASTWAQAAAQTRANIRSMVLDDHPLGFYSNWLAVCRRRAQAMLDRGTQRALAAWDPVAAALVMKTIETQATAAF